MFDYKILKKFLFQLEPETAHNFVARLLSGAKYCPACFQPIKRKNFILDDRLKQNYFGREFMNPVGMAAGFDKNATMVQAMPALGFGFTEIGTVTPKPQPGNPKPRLFRYPEQESLQNAMGFNNEGMAVVQKRIRDVYPFYTPIGINIGKNKVTPQEKAMDDYIQLIQGFKDLCDYLVINISSPNTPGLRDLQNEEFVQKLFTVAKEMTSKPVLLKIAPDMEIEKGIGICEIAIQNGAAGIIATNTHVDYTLLPNPKPIGGISGKAIREKSFRFFDEIAKELFGKTLLISVGGIDSGEEAYKRIKAGASLVQVYTGLIFQGPSLVRRINQEILEQLKRDGFQHIREAIGANRK